VLVTTDGARCDNILKVKPPLVFSCRDADRLVAALEATLEEFSGLPEVEQSGLLEAWRPPAEQPPTRAPVAPPTGLPPPEEAEQAPAKRQKA